MGDIYTAALDQLEAERDAALAQAEVLRRWKDEALVVLAAWETVWEAAGQPGALGASKANSVREYIAAARADAAAAVWQFETSIVHHARNVVKTYRADASIVAVAHAIEELARALGMDP